MKGIGIKQEERVIRKINQFAKECEQIDKSTNVLFRTISQPYDDLEKCRPHKLPPFNE